MPEVNQKLSTLEKPFNRYERYLVKRYDEADIEISLEVRDSILLAMSNGSRFVQIGKHTVMVNSIKAVEPKWGEKNIPPRPKEEVTYEWVGEGLSTKALKHVTNLKEIHEWDQMFRGK